MRRVCLLVALGLLVAACATDPRGARLGLQTAPVQRASAACDGAGAAPVRIERDGEAVVFVDVGSGVRRPMIWPFGFAAWLEFGRVVLYATDGTVVGREGDVLDNIGGSGDAEGFHVCSVGARTYQ
jgi:hypothetical protein